MEINANVLIRNPIPYQTPQVEEFKVMNIIPMGFSSLVSLGRICPRSGEVIGRHQLYSLERMLHYQVG